MTVSSSWEVVGSISRVDMVSGSNAADDAVPNDWDNKVPCFFRDMVVSSLMSLNRGNPELDSASFKEAPQTSFSNFSNASSQARMNFSAREL